ncbi:hypothetical protein C8R45DRAFT_935333 [Mycena sanguinolenta]|nr:hypothetical protein C8R45DRAFT_935333 [Mycena sanguinolenta]
MYRGKSKTSVLSGLILDPHPRTYKCLNSHPRVWLVGGTISSVSKGKARQKVSESNLEEETLSEEGSLQEGTWAKPEPRTTHASRRAGVAPSLENVSRKRKSTAEQSRSDAAQQTLPRNSAVKELCSTIQGRSTEMSMPGQSGSDGGVNPPQGNMVVNPGTGTPTQANPVQAGNVVVNPTVVNPQVENQVNAGMVGTSGIPGALARGIKVPSPWDKNSPNFDGKTAESLMRYLKHCRMICVVAGLKDDQQRKQTVLSFLPIYTQEEWQSLSKFLGGSFDEWITEIEYLFPEIRTFQIGSLKKLGEICRRQNGITKTDLGLIRRLNLSFTNEAEKLEKPPALVMNLKLVDEYLSCFSPQFCNEISQLMNQEIYQERKRCKDSFGVAGVAIALTGVDRPEETMSFRDLMKMVETMAEGNTMTSVAAANAITVGNSLGATSPEVVQLRAEVAEQFGIFAKEITRIGDAQAVIKKNVVEGFKKQEDRDNDSFQWIEDQIRQIDMVLKGSALQPEISLPRNSDREGQGFGIQGDASSHENSLPYPVASVQQRTSYVPNEQTYAPALVPVPPQSIPMFPTAVANQGMNTSDRISFSQLVQVVNAIKPSEASQEISRQEEETSENENESDRRDLDDPVAEEDYDVSDLSEESEAESNTEFCHSSRN